MSQSQESSVQPGFLPCIIQPKLLGCSGQMAPSAVCSWAVDRWGKTFKWNCSEEQDSMCRGYPALYVQNTGKQGRHAVDNSRRSRKKLRSGCLCGRKQGHLRLDVKDPHFCILRDFFFFLTTCIYYLRKGFRTAMSERKPSDQSQGWRFHVRKKAEVTGTGGDEGVGQCWQDQCMHRFLSSVLH